MLSNTKKPESLAAQAAVEQKTASKAEKPVEVSKAAEPKAEKSAVSAKTEKAAAAAKAKAEKAAAVAAAKAEKAAAAAKAKAEKTTARKRTVGARKTAAPEVKLYVQYQGKQISQEEAVEAVKAAWTGETIKTLELYVKPEDGAVYYVINGSETGKVTF